MHAPLPPIVYIVLRFLKMEVQMLIYVTMVTFSGSE